MDWMPSLRTELGTLRFFTITETRISEDEAGRAVLDTRGRRYSVDSGGTVKEAQKTEVTEFLQQLLHGNKGKEIERNERGV